MKLFATSLFAFSIILRSQYKTNPCRLHCSMELRVFKRLLLNFLRFCKKTLRKMNFSKQNKMKIQYKIHYSIQSSIPPNQDLEFSMILKNSVQLVSLMPLCAVNMGIEKPSSDLPCTNFVRHQCSQTCSALSHLCSNQKKKTV